MNYYLDTEFLEGTQQPRYWQVIKSNWLQFFVLIFVILVMGFLFNILMAIGALVMLGWITVEFIRSNSHKPTIDLISIGIVSEGETAESRNVEQPKGLVSEIEIYTREREYYAVSKDFNLKEAWNRYQLDEPTSYAKAYGYSGQKRYWIRENVLKPIFFDLLKRNHKEKYGEDYEDMDFSEWMTKGWSEQYTYKGLKNLINKYGKTNAQIAEEVKEFVLMSATYSSTEKSDRQLTEGKFLEPYYLHTHPINFYAYYADYDWVAFCWLFGKMIDLPKGFPMYCRDLKQELDFVLNSKNSIDMNNICAKDENYEMARVDHPVTLDKKLKQVKNLSFYPKQENEHNALADARWNKKLHQFILGL